MAWIFEAVLAFFAALGLFSLGWLLYGRLLFPAGRGNTPLYAVIAAQGDGETLEQDLRRLLWLREGRGAVAIVVADAGLTPRGRSLAQRLLAPYPGAVLCPAARLGEYLGG